MDSVFLKTIKALFWKGGERAANKLIRLVVQVLLARLLLPEDFGIIAIVLVFITLSDVFVLGGLNSALIQKDNITKVDYSTVFWLSTLLAALFFLLLWVSSPFIATLYSEEQLIDLLRFVALQFFPLAFNSVQIAKISRELNFRPIFISAIISEIFAGIVAVYLAFNGFGIWALAVQQVLAACLNCIVASSMIRWFPSFSFSAASAKELLSFGWRNAAIGLWGTLASGFYNLAIGKVYSHADLGYYTQGQRYPTAVSDMITGTLSSVLLSSFSMVKHDVLGRKKLLCQALRLFTLLIVPLLLFCFVFADEIVVALLSDKWSACIPIFQLFCLGLVLKSLSLIQRQALLAIGLAKECLRAATIMQGSRVLLLLPIMLFWHCDVVWVAAIWNFATVIEQVMLSRLSVKFLFINIAEQLKSIMPSFLIFFFAFILSSLANLFFGSEFIAMLIYIIAIVSFYFVLYKLLRRKQNG